MRRQTWKLTCVVLTLSVVASSCAHIPNKAWWDPHDSSPIDEGSKYKSARMVLEISEEGPVFHEDQSLRMKAWLEVQQPSAPVVMFVNGWHHNAEHDDANLRDFNSFIGYIEKASGMPVSAVYVGWRGDSLDTPIPIEGSDFLTIWGRKSASVVVGSEGLREILSYMRERHRDRQVYVIGHSLGGSALLYAVKHDLPKEANTHFEYFMLNPAVGSREFKEFEQKLSAALAETNSPPMFARNMQLSIERAYRKLTVLQARGDGAVRWGYPVAFLDKGIGFSRKWKTHRSYLCKSQDPCEIPDDPTCSASLVNGTFVVETLPTKGSNCTQYNQKPIWVILGEEGTFDGHNDILTSLQATALADIIGKRISFAAAAATND